MENSNAPRESFGKKIKRLTKLGVALFFGIVFIVIIMASIGGSGDSSPATQTPVVSQSSVTTPTPTPPEKPQRTEAQAQKELDEFMVLGKQAQLVTTYEFSERANVVYADKVWYTQSVQMKKDFLAYVAMLKKDINGYKHFEVRDAYSDEKIAEVTAFTGSLEVYK